MNSAHSLECAQAPILEGFKEELREFRQEYRIGQTRQIELLEKIAGFSERMDAQQKQTDKLSQDMNEVFHRIREIELQPGEEAIEKIKDNVRRRSRQEDNLFIAKISGVITIVAGVVLFLVQKVL